MNFRNLKESWIFWIFAGCIVIVIIYSLFVGYPIPSKNATNNPAQIEQQVKNEDITDKKNKSSVKDNTEVVKYYYDVSQNKDDETRKKYNTQNYINDLMSKFDKTKGKIVYDENSDTLYVTVFYNGIYNSEYNSVPEVQESMMKMADMTSEAATSLRKAQGSYWGVNTTVVCSIVDNNGKVLVTSTNGNIDYFSLTDDVE